MAIEPFHLIRTGFNSEHEIARYSAVEVLQPTEQAILDHLGDRLPQMDVLDVGVGGRL